MSTFTPNKRLAKQFAKALSTRKLEDKDSLHNSRFFIHALALAFVGVLLGLFGSSAQASDHSEYGSGSTITSESSSSSVDEAAVTAKAYIDAKANAKTLAYIKASGMSKSDHKYSKPKSITLKKAASYYTSYKNYAGKEVWHWKKYSKGKKFYLGRDGWYHDPLCNNKIVIKGKKLPKKAIIVKGKVKIVKSFTYTAKASAKATAYATASAKAWCKNEWTSAEASASATSSAYAYASASATGSTKGSAEASAKGAAKKLALSVSFQSSIKIRVQAEAKAKATADATAKVTCSTGPTTPPTTPKPQLLEIDTINDVLVNNTRTITPKGTVASGHTATLYCTAGTGTIVSGKSQTVNGNFSAPLTYKAGDEAGTDKVSCTLTQDDGQTASISTNTFEIRDHSTTEPN